MQKQFFELLTNCSKDIIVIPGQFKAGHTGLDKENEKETVKKACPRLVECIVKAGLQSVARWSRDGRATEILRENPKTEA